MSLPAWFDHLEESFSHIGGQVQVVLPACENQLPFAENVNEIPGITDEILQPSQDH